MTNREMMINSKMRGVVLLDKAKGITSNRALQEVKRLFGVKKAGHTGSLDPLATGMLPICIGEATKYSQFLLNADKEYEVTALLGVMTTTGDSEGDVIAEHAVPTITTEQLNVVLQQFTGLQQQLPPMFSALKHQGKPLYEYARRGITIDRKQRDIVIYSLKCLTFENNFLSLHVHCSKGTYIRTLVEDIAKALGCGGAHVTALRRTAISDWQAEQMHPLDVLSPEHILPIEVCVSHLPQACITDLQAKQLSHGQVITLPASTYPEGVISLYSPHGFIGLGNTTVAGHCRPKRLLAT